MAIFGSVTCWFAGNCTNQGVLLGSNAGMTSLHFDDEVTITVMIVSVISLLLQHASLAPCFSTLDFHCSSCNWECGLVIDVSNDTHNAIVSYPGPDTGHYCLVWHTACSQFILLNHWKYLFLSLSSFSFC